MLVTIDWIKKQYNYYNEKYWDGELPSISFKISNSQKTWGFATYRYNLYNDTVIPISITMSNYYDSPEEIKINTLLHEMIHIADYYYNPQHFVYNGRKISKRNYDAHGPVYFLKEAARLNSFGHNIYKNVQEWERDLSKLSNKNQVRVDNKLKNGINIILFRLSKEGDSYHGRYGLYTYCIVSPKNLKVWKDRFNYDRWYQTHFDCADLFVGYDEIITRLKINRGGTTSYCAKPINEFIEKYKLEFVENIIDKGNFSLGMSNNDETSIDDTNDERIPKFKWVVNTTQGQKVIEFNNITRDELKEKLQQAFPKCSEETIERILNNKDNYPMGMGKMNIMMEDIKEMVKKVIDEIQNNTENDIEQIGMRRRTKKINNYEGVESIE